MTTGKQAVALRQQASEPQAPKRQFVAVVHDSKYTRLSRSLVIPGEDAEALAALRQSLADDLKPRGTMENECVDEITACLWRLCRMRVIEAGVYAEAISLGPRYVVDPLVRNRFRRELGRLENWEPTQDEESSVLGWAFDRLYDTFGKLTTHSDGVERSLYRAMQMLERLQEARGGRSCPRIIDASS